VKSQAFCIVRRQETIRSLPGSPSGLHPYLPPGRPNNIGFLPRVVPEIALLILPFPLFPLRGTVRAFDQRSRLGLACWLRLSALECLNILADCLTYYALC
jgi:hypothetical protein